MATDSDIRTTAMLLIERFGIHAASKACEVAEGFACLGSRERQGLWIRIAQTAELLQNQRAGDPSDGDD